MTDITAVSDISAVNHQSSDAEKYKILTASQSFDRKYEFPQTQFGMKSNTCLRMHFEEGNKNKTIQNQLIQIMSNQILEGIITKVKTAKYFAVAADETTDHGNQTQLTMTLRYVDEQGE